MLLYRLAASLLALPILARAAVRGQLRARLGLEAAAPVDIWLHGASVGEMTSARPLVAALLAAEPGLRIVATANTVTGLAQVAGWALPQVVARLAPVDGWGATRRFVTRHRPRALIVLENELWPGRITDAHRAELAVMLVGARLSERSARRWARLAPRLVAAMLGRVRLASAQDAASAARLARLGLPVEAMVAPVMLKAAVAAVETPTLPFALPPRNRVALAASTHPGEETAVLEGFASARAAKALDLLILAPRHPDRGPDVARLIAATGLPFATRSRGEVPGPETAVYLADTLGEMALWYRAAGITLVCGSFTDRGGHTPYEPAQAGSAILHGPDTTNFTEAYAELEVAGAAVQVEAAGIGAALIATDAAKQARLSAAARQALRSGGGDLEALARAILDRLPAP